MAAKAETRDILFRSLRASFVTRMSAQLSAKFTGRRASRWYLLTCIPKTFNIIMQRINLYTIEFRFLAVKTSLGVFFC